MARHATHKTTSQGKARTLTNRAQRAYKAGALRVTAAGRPAFGR